MALNQKTERRKPSGEKHYEIENRLGQRTASPQLKQPSSKSTGQEFGARLTLQSVARR